MIDLNEKSLKKLQNVELEILIEIDRICRKNDINYSLTGGTLLGAVRHGGFIPWDDDADISMLRSDYVKFQKACKVDLDMERFYFQDIEVTPGYRWGYGKIRRKNSLFLRENQEHMPYRQGIFVDVFPRDGIPDQILVRKFHHFLCFALRKIMWSPIGRKTSKNAISRFVYSVLCKIPKAKILEFYRFLVSFSNKRETKYVRALTFPLPNNIKGYNRQWYETYTTLSFENKKFKVEASYIKWLRREFGDYMTLPPVGERKIHPITKIEFPDREVN